MLRKYIRKVSNEWKKDRDNIAERNITAWPDDNVNV